MFCFYIQKLGKYKYYIFFTFLLYIDYNNFNLDKHKTLFDVYVIINYNKYK